MLADRSCALSVRQLPGLAPIGLPSPDLRRLTTPHGDLPVHLSLLSFQQSYLCTRSQNVHGMRRPGGSCCRGRGRAPSSGQEGQRAEAGLQGHATVGLARAPGSSTHAAGQARGLCGSRTSW